MFQLLDDNYEQFAQEYEKRFAGDGLTAMPTLDSYLSFVARSALAFEIPFLLAAGDLMSTMLLVLPLFVHDGLGLVVMRVFSPRKGDQAPEVSSKS
ncbi:MAG: hypothetical protein ABFS09_06060 [Thermodesulfobacteriota bacterium]